MTKEWQEASNEYLKVGLFHLPATKFLKKNKCTNTLQSIERKIRTYHRPFIRRLPRPGHGSEQAFGQELRRFGRRGVKVHNDNIHTAALNTIFFVIWACLHTKKIAVRLVV
jgi:hypothetical protein